MNQESLRKSLEIKSTGYNQWEIKSKTSHSGGSTVMTTEHKYGKNLEYIYYWYYDVEAKNYITQPLHRILWIYFKGDVPEGYQIDHINNNSLDNDFSNLQLLTVRENILKRGPGKNQYTALMSDECILKLRREREMEKQEITEVREKCKSLEKELENLKAEYKAMINGLENEIKESREEWHRLCKNRKDI